MDLLRELVEPVDIYLIASLSPRKVDKENDICWQYTKKKKRKKIHGEMWILDYLKYS